MPKYEMTLAFEAATDEDARAALALVRPQSWKPVKLAREDTYMREIPLDARKEG